MNITEITRIKHKLCE